VGFPREEAAVLEMEPSPLSGRWSRRLRAPSWMDGRKDTYLEEQILQDLLKTIGPALH
jgi:hypothetical protein